MENHLFLVATCVNIRFKPFTLFYCSRVSSCNEGVTLSRWRQQSRGSAFSISRKKQKIKVLHPALFTLPMSTISWLHPLISLNLPLTLRLIVSHALVSWPHAAQDSQLNLHIREIMSCFHRDSCKTTLHPFICFHILLLTLHFWLCTECCTARGSFEL